jgi:hypothetical protein
VVARKPKTYQTSVGFYDLAIAAPSMKASLDAWGAGSNLFHQGVAKETNDPDVAAATMTNPGVVLKRPAGSTGVSQSTPIFPPTWGPVRMGSDAKGAGQSRRSAQLLRSANGTPESPPPISRRSRSAVRPRSGARGLPGGGIANGVRRRRR